MQEKKPYEPTQIAAEAIQRSFRPMPLDQSLSGQIMPDPSLLGKWLCERRSIRNFSDQPIPQKKLEQILVDCAGGVRIASYGSAEHPINMLLRTIPQGGGISSVHTHLILLRPSDDMKRGFYKFCPFTNSLHLYKNGINEDEVIAALKWYEEDTIQHASAILVISANLELKAYKYGDLGGRLALMEVGCALQNASISAQVQGIAAYAHGGADYEKLAELFGLAYPDDVPFVNLIMGMP